MGKKMLVVEDELDILKAIEVIFKTTGFEVVTALSGKTALLKLKNFRPDIILLDIMMPIMDGWETIEKIKESEETKDIPIIVVTAKGANIHHSIAKSFHIDDYIVKPFHKTDLIQRVNKVLEQR